MYVRKYFIFEALISDGKTYNTRAIGLWGEPRHDIYINLLDINCYNFDGL